jgi:hypothetical protein
MKALYWAGLLLALAACGSRGGVGSGEISGRVSLSGGSAAGTQVIACCVADECATMGQTTASGDGGYRITGLRDGEDYVVLGFLSTDGDEEAEYAGWYERVDREPTLVRPPRTGVDFQLVPTTE